MDMEGWCSDGPNGWTDLGARRGVVSEVWTFYVRSRMEHTYAYLLRLRANAKTALFRATPLTIVIVFELLFFFRWFRQLWVGFPRVFLASANTLSGLVITESGGNSVLQRLGTAAAPLRIGITFKLNSNAQLHFTTASNSLTLSSRNASKLARLS